MEAARSLGVPSLSDHNSGPLAGVSQNSLTIHGGRRVSAADAYLSAEVLARENLTVVTGARIHRLAFRGDRVTGAEVERAGEALVFEATQVILCLGAVRRRCF